MRTFRAVMYISWIQALIAMLMSLYYSEIRHFVPCSLCWYQRIFMYPLVVILPIALIRKDRKVYQYIMPLSILGLFTAFYQVLLQVGIIPEAMVPCSNGVSCTTNYVTYFGFISIPVLSLLAFSIITAGMLYLWKGAKKS